MKLRVLSKLAGAGLWLVPVFLAASAGAAGSAGRWAGSDEFLVKVLPAGGHLAAFGGGRVDMGAISNATSGAVRHGRGSNQSFGVQRSFQLQVERRTGRPGRVALSASLVRGCRECTVSIDGIAITLAPQVILPMADLNRPTSHRLEIEIPVSAAPGPIDAEIGWEVTER